MAHARYTPLLQEDILDNENGVQLVAINIQETPLQEYYRYQAEISHAISLLEAQIAKRDLQEKPDVLRAVLFFLIFSLVGRLTSAMLTRYFKQRSRDSDYEVLEKEYDMQMQEYSQRAQEREDVLGRFRFSGPIEHFAPVPYHVTDLVWGSKIGTCNDFYNFYKHGVYSIFSFNGSYGYQNYWNHEVYFAYFQVAYPEDYPINPYEHSQDNIQRDYGNQYFNLNTKNSCMRMTSLWNQTSQTLGVCVQPARQRLVKDERSSLMNQTQMICAEFSFCAPPLAAICADIVETLLVPPQPLSPKENELPLNWAVIIPGFVFAMGCLVEMITNKIYLHLRKEYYSELSQNERNKVIRIFKQHNIPYKDSLDTCLNNATKTRDELHLKNNKPSRHMFTICVGSNKNNPINLLTKTDPIIIKHIFDFAGISVQSDRRRAIVAAVPNFFKNALNRSDVDGSLSNHIRTDFETNLPKQNGARFFKRVFEYTGAKKVVDGKQTTLGMPVKGFPIKASNNPSLASDEAKSPGHTL